MISPKLKPETISLEIQDEPKFVIDKRKIENTSKLDISDYLINKTFKQMIKFLKGLVKERAASDPVAIAIDKATKKCPMDIFSEEEVEDLKIGLKMLLDRRIAKKRQIELGGGDIPVCHIARNNQKFRDKVNGNVQLPSIVQKGPKSCKHQVTESEIF